jgi:hypothetical protein
VGGGTYEVERRRHIASPPGPILERLVDFRRWPGWSPWEDVDPDLRRRYAGAEAGVGAVYEWEGNRKAGKGRMEIVEVDATSVTIDLRFLKPFRSHSSSRFVVVPEAAGSEVTWRMTGENTTMLKVMGIFTSMDAVIGPDFEKGLDRLRADVEASEAAGGAGG